MGSRRLALGFTLAFVESWLRGRRRLLEVGAGDGELARALLDRGHEVTALDLDEEAVAAARERGVDARVARFPDCSGGPFDGVLFTRSLHHVQPLGDAIRRAAELLAPAGRLVIEDWAWNRVDAATAGWMYRLVRDWQERGLAPREEFPRRGSPLASWRREHERDCHLHPDHAMREAVAAVLTPTHEERVPYFFRYPCRWLANRPRGEEAAAAVLELERAGIERRAIVPIGWRLVAERASG